MLGAADLQALGVSLLLAAVTVIGLLACGLPLAWWLARRDGTGKAWLEAVIALPLVLPPTVLGFYLLLLLGKTGPLAAVGLPPLAFSFGGLVVGSMIYSLPFVVQPLITGFENIDQRRLDAAATLGAGPRDRFFSVALPGARSAIITGAVLGFAHTLGEFGVVLMLGGSLPGETRVASIAIYQHVESMDLASAHALSAVLVVISLVLLVPTYILRRRSRS